MPLTTLVTKIQLLLLSLIVPIAIRKEVRTCSQHPISKFVSYNSLSPSYHAFVSSLSYVSITQGWKEAITNPKWKEAMVEEIKLWTRMVLGS